MSNDIRALVDAIKKGIITPETFAISGDLPHQQSRKFIDLVVKQDGFFQEVTREPMGRLKKDLNVIDIARRLLVRVPEGQRPIDSQWAGVLYKPKTLQALDVQLFAKIGFSTLLDHSDDPKFEDRILEGFAKVFVNDLMDLGFNGTADDNSGGFLTLNKGWIAIAKESSATHKVTFSAGQTWTDKLDAVLTEMPDRFRAGAAFVMNQADFDDYLDEMGAKQGGLQILITGKGADTFKGYRIIRHPMMPAGHLLLTNPVNLVFGYLTRVQRQRQVKPVERAVEYVFTIWCDYQIAVDEALVIGYPA